MLGITIIIVNWNAGDQLRRCLESITEFGGRYVTEIFVVDNASTDGSERVAEGRSNCSLIRLNSNVGFGRACNIGAARASSHWLLFLNPDAALLPMCLERLSTFCGADSNAEVGVFGVQLIDESGGISRSCARLPRPLNFVAGSLGLKHFGHTMSEWDHRESREVDHVIGAFYLVRRDLFESLHGFDERFFVYLEDLDFSLRVKREGWKIVYFGGAQAFHAGGGTSRQVKSLRLFYSLRSKIQYAFKNYSAVAAASVLFVAATIEPLARFGVALASGSRSSLRETWVAYCMLWRWLPRWLLRRELS